MKGRKKERTGDRDRDIVVVQSEQGSRGELWGNITALIIGIVVAEDSPN